jgi:hypothetical protein
MYATVHKTRKESKILKWRLKLSLAILKILIQFLPILQIRNKYCLHRNIQFELVRNLDDYLTCKSPKFAKSTKFLNARMAINITTARNSERISSKPVVETVLQHSHN